MMVKIAYVLGVKSIGELARVIYKVLYLSPLFLLKTTTFHGISRI